MPITKENKDPKAKLRSPKALRSTMGCRAVNARQKNSTAPQSDATVQITITSSSNQPFWGPSSSTYSAAPRNVAMPRRPNQSKLSSSDQLGLSKSISA